MRLELSKHLDRQRWDDLVGASGGSVFSLSAYLDATADNWAVLWNEDRSGGMVCPFAVKLGVKILYAPFFHRYSEWIGAKEPDLDVLIGALKSEFSVADAHVRHSRSPGEKMYQVNTEARYAPNQQSKRMLKKAAGYAVGEQERSEELFALLRRELSPRVAGIDDRSLAILEKLVAAIRPLQLNLLEDGTWKGAIWLVPYNGRMLYLKGTVEADAKKNGGMYRLMEHAQQLAFGRGMLFDFGGSNAEGVRRFNLNWGAGDVFYHHLRWNNAPLPWKLLKSVKEIWSK